MYQKFINFKNCISNNQEIKLLIVIFLIIFSSINFHKNQYKVADQSFFNNFQKDSEALVLGKIAEDKYNKSTDYYGLGFVSIDEKFVYGKNTIDGYSVINENIEPKDYLSYKSQVGLHGYIYSFIFNKLKIDSINKLKFITSFFSAIVLVVLTLLFWKIIGKLFASIFFTTIFFSPWIVSFSGNLYWVSFLWFLPAIFSFLVFVDIDNKRKYIWLFCFMLSIFIKSLCGYEYLSTIVLFALSVFFIAPFLENNSISKNRLLKYAVTIFGLSIFGFLLSISIHSLLRGEGDLLLGLKNIYEQDILRRTFGGDATKFAPAYSNSLNASLLDVLKKYIFEFNTDLLKGKSGKFFPVLIILNIIILFKTKSFNIKKLNSAMFIVFSLAPLSWYFLGKSHSFIHTHMNYVLWYFGFIAVLIYIPIQYFYNLFLNCIEDKDVNTNSKP